MHSSLSLEPDSSPPPGRLGSRQTRCLPGPSDCSLASAGRSVSGRPGRAHGQREVSPAGSRSCAPCRPVPVPARWRLRRLLPLSALVLSLNLSLRTNSAAGRPSPDQWQARPQADDPAPSAAASPHLHPPRLLRNWSLPQVQLPTPPPHPRAAKQPPGPARTPHTPPHPTSGQLAAGESETQGLILRMAGQCGAESLGSPIC